MNLRTLLATTAVLLLVLVPSVWARKWSDKFGNSMEAKFVRVHDGKIVFLRSGKVVMVPFGDLVAEDQQFLRDDLEKKGQAHLLPAVQPDRFPTGDDGNWSEAGDGDGPALPIVQRVWTDVDDRKITAGLVRTGDDTVILLMDGEEVTVPMTRLSRFDQNFVRQWTAAEKMAKATASHTGTFPSGGDFEAGGGAGRPPWASGGPGAMSGYDGPGGGQPMYGSGSRSPYGGAEYDSEYEEEPEEEYEEEYEEEPEEEYESGSAYAGEQEQYASNMPAARSRGGSNPYSGGLPSFSPPSFSPPSSGPHSSMPHAPTVPQMPSMPEPSFEEVGLCSNCNKEVSAEFGAGDHCPHCGVFFEYEEDEYGNKTEATSGSGSSDLHTTGRSIRGIVKLVIFGFVGVASLIGWVCRKLFS